MSPRAPGSGLPPNIRGALWMTFAAAMFSVMSVAVRYLSGEIPPIEMVAARCIVAILTVGPWLMRRGIAGLRAHRKGLLALRAVITAVAVFCWFYALGQMKLADAVALHFTLPLFGVVLAVVMLHEKVGIHRWSATVIGFLGVLVVLRPGMAEISLAALAVLVSAALYAVASIQSKILMRTENAGIIVFYMNAYIITFIAVPLALQWVTPTPWQLALLIAVGGCNTLAQLAIQKAFDAGEASAVLPFDFLRLPITALAGFALFSEVPDIWTALGAIIIFGSAYYIAWRERRRGKGADGGG
jgi:drug/metabolite transporter (DMT)-like permease